MASRICCFIILILALQMVVSVTSSRPFLASNNHDAVVANSLNQTGTTSESSLEARNGSGGGGGGGVQMEEHSKGLSKIGSSPPSCEHKCYGCDPCEAIQVPTISKNHKHLGVLYTNYEPEGWKCKCGSSFYSP